jgi:hypothetical protein
MLLESRSGSGGGQQIRYGRTGAGRVVLDLATVLCSGYTRCGERIGLDPGWSSAASGCGGESRTAASLVRVERTLSPSLSVGKQSDVVGEDDRARVEVWERRQRAAAQDLKAAGVAMLFLREPKAHGIDLRSSRDNSAHCCGPSRWINAAQKREG